MFVTMIQALAMMYPALAASPAQKVTTTYHFGERTLRFIRLEQEGLLVSESCRGRSSALACQAIDATKKVTLRNTRDQLNGGVNPGALVCTTQAAGTVVLGVDEKDNEQTFCLFSDGSLISNDSLGYHARKNYYATPATHAR